MAFLKSSQLSLGPKTVDVKGFTQAETLKLGDRAYTEHEVLLADSYSIVGDVTVSDDLIISKLSDDGNAITITGDTTTRTISGSGSIQGATLAQTPNATVTGMTGTIGSNVVFPTGTVLNVVSTTKSDIQQLAAAYTETTISGLTCTITPKYTTSKIYISGHVCIGHPVSTAWSYIAIFRGSTRIGQGPTDGSSIRGHSASDNRPYAMRSLPIHYMDSPSTTSAIVYSLKHGSGSANPRINKDGEAAGTNHVTGVSTLTVMEIAG